jgi:hypothetical protein
MQVMFNEMFEIRFEPFFFPELNLVICFLSQILPQTTLQLQKVQPMGFLTLVDLVWQLSL